MAIEPSLTALSIRSKSWYTTRPAPMFKCPTSLFPIWPSGSPTCSPWVTKVAWPWVCTRPSKTGVFAVCTALLASGVPRPHPSRMTRAVFCFMAAPSYLAGTPQRQARCVKPTNEPADATPFSSQEQKHHLNWPKFPFETNPKLSPTGPLPATSKPCSCHRTIECHRPSPAHYRTEKGGFHAIDLPRLALHDDRPKKTKSKVGESAKYGPNVRLKGPCRSVTLAVGWVRCNRSFVFCAKAGLPSNPT